MFERIITPELRRAARVAMGVIEAIQALTRASCFSPAARFSIDLHCADEQAALNVAELLGEGIEREFRGDATSRHLVAVKGNVLRIDVNHTPARGA